MLYKDAGFYVVNFILGVIVHTYIQSIWWESTEYVNVCSSIDILVLGYLDPVCLGDKRYRRSFWRQSNWALVTLE